MYTCMIYIYIYILWYAMLEYSMLRYAILGYAISYYTRTYDIILHYVFCFCLLVLLEIQDLFAGI